MLCSSNFSKTVKSSTVNYQIHSPVEQIKELKRIKYLKSHLARAMFSPLADVGTEKNATNSRELPPQLAILKG